MEEILNLDIDENRYSRLELIPWWNQELLHNSTIMVVGAGAIGNELIKNLALLGIGKILIIDMDKIEQTNLTRSILYRMSDVGKYKAEAAAEKAVEINPDVRAIPLKANIVTDIGLGVFRKMDVVLGGLDNREARLSINQFCYKVNKPWIDGAIEVLNGFARVFVPPGPCYECTMTENDWNLINKRKSCALLTHEQILEGKTPTTPTSSSIIAGIQVQEMLKLLHNDRKLPTLAGKGYVFNGLTHDSFVVEYQRKDDCMSHDIYEDIKEMPWSARDISIRDVLNQAKKDLGDSAILEFDRDIVTIATCSCGHSKNIFNVVNKLSNKDIVCEKCGKTMRFETFHSIYGDENFLDKKLFDIGIPLFHIISSRSGLKYIHYELSNDKNEVLGGLFE
ncbi:HesA/MoeB/ThiF family protein [Clostridium taeniosporum]|uniref:Molybdopterin biosynthesis protein MoeB n=1 Tax=Clostridium taeniosporum TaxID=394958 RepID=A0A1D7XJX1_9CLOT|nr:ThiF family adenylyltransferase [Clostridium taeniosporum]AOR23480.1 molybdopterin biosynthesis protein MoeB [Clostridium taeniosporum]